MIKVDVRSSTPSSLVPDPMSFATPQKAVVKDKGNGYSCPFCTSCFAHCSVQWGFATVSMNQQATTFTYPIALTNAWVGFTQHANTESVYHGFATQLNKSSMRIFIDNVSSSANTSLYVLIIGQ